ncbi:MAG: Type II secretion system protein E [Clostridia bacterium 41_269]|nr:MAG: Type II secretion system protein E [Clostridia bacterium 41_269]
MPEKLEFIEEDWLSHIERERERIIDEIALDLATRHPEIFENLSLKESNYDEVREIVRSAVLTRKDLAPDEIDIVVEAILGQSTGYGVLQEFFVGEEAKEITEVFINPSADGIPKVFYGRRGRTWPAGKQYFKSNEEVLRYCQKICEDAGRPFTEDSPIVDAWLKDGSRLAVIGFKASPLGIAATIRKSPVTRPPMPLERLVENKMLPQFVADMIVDLLVKGHANLGIFGRTDSGKTTFMRALALHIDPIDRVFIAETSFEIYMPNLPNCVNLVEVVYGDKTIVDMTQLCKTMNRNNPDRAIVGELRSKEIIAASQMASSTSGGFWTTGHAGSINDLRTRLFGMFLDGGVQLPRNFLDEQIASMFDFVIFLDKEKITEDEKGRRRLLMSVVEVIPGKGYRTIIEFDTQAFAESGGKVMRWKYVNPISEEKLAKLVFAGGKMRDEYAKVMEPYIEA